MDPTTKYTPSLDDGMATLERAIIQGKPIDNATMNSDKRKPRTSISTIKSVATKCGVAMDIIKCILVRLCLIGGNFLVAWRTVIETDDNRLWSFLGFCIGFMVVEGCIVLYKNRGREWMRWCPCFVIYLGTTLPLIWFLQFQQHHLEVEKINRPIGNDTNAFVTPSALMGSTMDANLTTLMTTTQSIGTKFKDINFDRFFSLQNKTWIIIVNQSIVYLIILGRWFLPRGKVSREFLAGLLLEYLAIASDIMELLAILDEEIVIRLNYELHVWILTVWTISFLQFIPILLHKRQFEQPSSPHLKCIHNSCGKYFVEILSTIMSILLQDFPFLIVRLYIIFNIELITYSLAFFVLKNFVTLMLLLYRLVILLYKITCCCGTQPNDEVFSSDESTEDVRL